jgi:hypothetical protein
MALIKFIAFPSMEKNTNSKRKVSLAAFLLFVH